MMKKILLTAFAAAMTVTLTAQEQQPMRLWYNHEARLFEESLPIGNGKLGALVYGGADDNLIYLNDITLWTGRPVDRNEGEGLSAYIPKIREALFREDYRTADSLQMRVEGHNSQCYQPLGTLHIYDWNQGKVRQYRRELDIDSALCRDRYVRDGVTFTREYIASNPDHLLAIRLKASRAGAINCRITLGAQEPHRVRGTRYEVRGTESEVRGARYEVRSAGGEAANAQLTMTGHATGDAQQSVHFCTIVRLGETDGELTTTDEGITLRHATEATIYIVNETTYNGPQRHPVTEGAPYLERATDAIWHTVNTRYDEVRAKHVADYQQFYDRVKLSIGATAQNAAARNIPTDSLLRRYPTADAAGGTGAAAYLETLYFQYGRYLLISCSRTKGVPANLQGLWTPHLWSPWRGNYTVNINLEENYWPAFTANLAEMAEPLDDFIQALADNGTYTARNFYGISQGWCSSHNSDLWAMTNPVGEQRESPMWACWNMGGAWLVNTLWERYQFTQDRDYLKRVAYPLMRGAADFCVAWLIDNPKKPGELITAPSTSPENEYVTPDGYRGVSCYGGTADLAIIRELLTNTIAAARLCGGNTATYQRTLQKLHPYTIGAEGDLNEWYHDWADADPHHRHQSHLIGLYPGNHIYSMGNGTWSMENDDYTKRRHGNHNSQLSTLNTQLLTACRQTLVQKGDQTTGWSTGWRINLWARLHDGEQAYHIYQKLLSYVDGEHYSGPDRRHGGGTYSNLFDAHPPFQIDGNFGGTAGVCEMLMQSRTTVGAQQGTVIELLPALPAAWRDGAVSGLCARGGYEVSFEWKDGQVRQATIKARQAGTVVLKYNNTEKKLKLKAGQTMPVKTW